MKHILLLLLTILFIGAKLNAQIVNIPDANFKSYLIGNAAINTNGDTEIQISEAVSFNGLIDVSNSSIVDLTGIEFFTKTRYIYCNDNLLSSLDITQNIALVELNCSGNLLTSLNVAENIYLTHLICNYNSLSGIDVSQNVALSWLICNSNSIDSLDVTQNTALTRFDCYENLITSIDVTQNTALVNFGCNSNLLNTLDVTQNTLLTSLNCQFNSLTSLDLTQNTLLYFLHCENNFLSTLDLTNAPELYAFSCSNNLLRSLNIASGNNTHISATSFGFNSTGNPNLNCIKVDAGFLVPSVWQHDMTVSFSDDCLVLVNSIIVQGESGVSTISTNGDSLQMEAIILPTNADDATYAWSVNNITGSAIISATGLLTASAEGKVEVVASANDASGAVGTKIITLSNQTVGINDLALQNLNIYPNPTNGLINLKFLEKLNPIALASIKIMDLTGKIIKVFNAESKQLNISEFTTGIYFLEIGIAERKSLIKVVMQ